MMRLFNGKRRASAGKRQDRQVRGCKRGACALVALMTLAWSLFSGCISPQPKRYTASCLDVFDTVTQIVLYETDKARAERYVERIHTLLTEYHQLYDIYNAYEGVNNLYAVNEAAGGAPIRVDARITELVVYAKTLYAQTDGRMNIALGSVLSLWRDARQAGIADPEHAALPDEKQLLSANAHTSIDDVLVDAERNTVRLADEKLRLDVGAVAKGYAACRVAEQLRQEGLTSLLLNVGGNVVAVGTRGDGQPWNVAVQSPQGGEQSLCSVQLKDTSLVTSGSYERYFTVDGVCYHHIIDPDTLMPAAYFDSVSVTAKQAGLADALSTALFCLPLHEGQALLKRFDGAEAMWCDRDGAVACTEGFAANFAE